MDRGTRETGFHLAQELVRAATIDETSEQTSQTFDRLLGFLCEVADRDVLREINNFLYVHLAGRQIPLPPTWHDLVATYGDEVVGALAEEGVIELKMKMFRAIEADPMAVFGILRRAGFV